jgi:carboxymethylenebutenolidase
MAKDYGPAAFRWLTRRSVLRGLALGCGGGVAAPSLLGSCTDEEVAVSSPPDAAVAADAAAAAPDVAGLSDAAVDIADDVPGDATPDSSADASEDLAADAGAPVAPDAAADVRPGILSVPPDHPDVLARDLTFGANLRGYLAVPSFPGTFAGLVLIPEEGGLTDHIRDVARRFARSGCAAIVPDLSGRSPETLIADLNAALDSLAAQPQLGANRYGAAGFGQGGTQALRFAAATPRVRAVVTYYAPVPTPADALRTITAAVLGHYAMLDLVVNAGVPELERVLKEAGRAFDKRFYLAGHGFNDDTAPTYDESATLGAWSPTLLWFESYLAS